LAREFNHQTNGIAAANTAGMGFKELKMSTKIRTSGKMRKSGKGLTIIEILVLLSALAVVVAFTSPLLRDRYARADVQEATLQVALALHNAKNSARRHHVAVTVRLTTNPSDNAISFEFPDARDGVSRTVPALADVTLPRNVSVNSDSSALTFGPLGTVNGTTTIELAVATGTDFFARVMLNSLQGRVKTSYGLH
jgi:Tfp pilus assembly protein FimT